jgi:hypothetical protein
MEKPDRKALIRAFKESKPATGIYGFRCTASGQLWIGYSPNLGAVRNRMRFQFAQGFHREPSLRDAAALHGAGSFVFEIIETFKEDIEPLLLPDMLKTRKAFWIAELGAEPLL